MVLSIFLCFNVLHMVQNFGLKKGRLMYLFVVLGFLSFTV
jgi:hypothetical protein